MLGNNVKSIEVMGKDYKNESCYSAQGKTTLTRRNTPNVSVLTCFDGYCHTMNRTLSLGGNG